MKTKFIYIGILAGLLSLTFTACDDDITPAIEELELNRVLSPTGLIARIRTLTSIELTWNLRDDAAHYVVEFSEGNLDFTTIIRTVTVMPDELPLLETFDGETQYSARVKGVSNSGVADSKWSTVTITTAQENIYLPIEDGDIAATEATLRWPANSDVTHLLITPGNITRNISAGEKTAGVATITGLTGDTQYTVSLMRETKSRGTVTFRTLIDVGDAFRVYPDDDLNAVITAAAAGEVLVLYPGDYTVYTGTIVIDKSITIRGLYPFDKPLLHVAFVLANGAGDLTLTDLDLDGSGKNTLIEIPSGTTGFTFTSVNLLNCNIHDFARQLFYGNAGSTLGSFTVDNCVVSNFIAGGGDFIDFRSTYVANVTLTNSTFNNCAPARDFIRIDAASGFSGTGLTSTVLIDHCTVYKSPESAAVGTRRLLYVRFNANVLTVRNTIIAESGGFFSNQTTTSQHTSLNNNYFNAPRFHDAAFETISNLKVDNSGTFTTLDPGFTNAAAGNFKVTNQTLLDNAVGDPRWLQ